jgi:hypothetical protein
MSAAIKRLAADQEDGTADPLAEDHGAPLTAALQVFLGDHAPRERESAGRVVLDRIHHLIPRLRSRFPRVSASTWDDIRGQVLEAVVAKDFSLGDAREGDAFLQDMLVRGARRVGKPRPTTVPLSAAKAEPTHEDTPEAEAVARGVGAVINEVLSRLVSVLENDEREVVLDYLEYLSGPCPARERPRTPRPPWPDVGPRGVVAILRCAMRWVDYDDLVGPLLVWEVIRLVCGGHCPRAYEDDFYAIEPWEWESDAEFPEKVTVPEYLAWAALAALPWKDTAPVQR